MSSSGKKHASSGPLTDQPSVPEPSFAERTRTLVYWGALAASPPTPANRRASHSAR